LIIKKTLVNKNFIIFSLDKNFNKYLNIEVSLKYSSEISFLKETKIQGVEVNGTR